MIQPRKIALLAIILCTTCWPRIDASNNEPFVDIRDKKVAIVIDDLGNAMAGTEEIMTMPIPLTVAVMPFLPATKRDAEMAHKAGHEVIVHLPMEPLGVRKKGVGPGAITTELTEEEIRQKVHAAIDDVPYAVGVNNHMGSKATANPRVMKAVLEVCMERGLFFLDSKTNYESVVLNVAEQVGVQALENHLFLDDISSKAHIGKQMKRIHAYLSDHNYCIAIGHVGRPGKNTASVIKSFDFRYSQRSRFCPGIQFNKP